MTVEIVSGGLMDRWYKKYLQISGNGRQEREFAGVFLRKLLIWTPFYLVFMEYPVLAICAVLGMLHPDYAIPAVLVCLLWIDRYAIIAIGRSIGQYWNQKQSKLNRIVIKIPK